MNADDKMRFAAGETEDMASAPSTGVSESEAVRKDMAYSPASESETEQKQDAEGLPGSVDDDIDPSDVRAVPGTGGPDDTGDVDVDPDDLNMPGRG